MKTKKIFLSFLILNTFIFFAQSSQNRVITYGLYVGGMYSKMDNVPDVIVPVGDYTGYSFDTKGKFGGFGGIYLNWKYQQYKISIQPEVFFSQQKTDLIYSDIKDLNYKINLNYTYLNTGVMFKYYPIDNLYFGAGPYFGFNLNKDNISYTSNGEELSKIYGSYFQPDAVVQKVLKESLKGEDHFYIQFGMGYEFQNHITIGARYSLGISDALETQENGFKYIENVNKINAFSMYVGYIFDFDSITNF